MDFDDGFIGRVSIVVDLHLITFGNMGVVFDDVFFCENSVLVLVEVVGVVAVVGEFPFIIFEFGGG